MPAVDPQHGGQALEDLWRCGGAGLYRGGRHVGHRGHGTTRTRGPAYPRSQVGGISIRIIWTVI